MRFKTTFFYCGDQPQRTREKEINEIEFVVNQIE